MGVSMLLQSLHSHEHLLYVQLMHKPRSYFLWDLMKHLGNQPWLKEGISRKSLNLQSWYNIKNLNYARTITLSLRRSKLNQILINYLTYRVCSRNSCLTLLLHSDGLFLVSAVKEFQALKAR